MLDPNTRYIQIAFNFDANQVRRILPQIPQDPRIIIEAGTPYIKFTGIAGIRLIRRMWRGLVVADLKVTDGAVNEVLFAARSGANAATVMGSAPTETVDLFNAMCARSGLYSMVDMLGVDDPLRRLMPLKNKPNFVVIHKGRDEESSRRKLIRYKDISKISSKFDSFIAVAGGLVPSRVRSAYFNGADVAILNIVKPGDPYKGIPESADFRSLIPSILREVGK
ncbi:MAG: orotidine 5'-phosphate decarboxylase / HUMPS family protein [Candidatus Heimdallarchaeaceae archaeon]